MARKAVCGTSYCNTPVNSHRRAVQEAISKAHTAWASAAVPASIQELLDSPSAAAGEASSTFWVLVAALKRFVVSSDAEPHAHAAVQC